MGSVSSLIPGHSLSSKHCRASQYKLTKKGANSKQRSGRGLDGLLKYGFSQDPSGTNNNNKGLLHPGNSEDFFYIKVGHKSKTNHRRNVGAMEDRDGPPATDIEAGRRTPPELIPMSGKLEKSAEKALIRPTAFKPVLPRSSSSSMETHNSLNQILGHGLSPSERAKCTSSEPKQQQQQQQQQQDAGSGTLTDSGRDSMSSLPTHSTGCGSQLDGTNASISTSASNSHLLRYSGSSHSVTLLQQQQQNQNQSHQHLHHHLNSANSSGLSSGSGGSTWVGENGGIGGEMTVGSYMNSTSNGITSANTSPNGNANLRPTSTLDDSLMAAMNLNKDIAAAATAAGLHQSDTPRSLHSLELFSESPPNTKPKNSSASAPGTTTSSFELAATSSGSGGCCVRSPISTDDSLIFQLERKLLERESELQELQVCLEDKEAETCQLFEEKQRYCAEEMHGLKQRCSTKLRQASQRALKAQQVLQLQVVQLQQDKEQLQEEVERLERDREAAEGRLRSYEREKSQLAPTLEETQWEVCQKSGEISLLKQQLKDSQADAAHKLGEIVGLKGALREAKAKMEELERKNKENEDALHSRCAEVEVCQNELQRKKNEAELLREKVGRLETDIKGMKQELGLAKEEQVKLQSSRAKMEEEQLKLQIARAKMEVFGVNGGKKEGVDSVGNGKAEGNGLVATQQTDRMADTDTATLQREVERMRKELVEERQKKDKMVNSFQQERQTWNKEKDKVIRYQKQLQYNYLQMHKKNQDLEKILRELTAEMESRPGLDMDIHSSPHRYDNMVATEI
ncbi:leucine zipper putative tumor suppressor 2 homolog [Engraulis encrasicolus]|uniref:leucine zipper putative tumor suppressor 2 homolog n=1 Tax=Engraulis encrasicolus TaxID=184585 RepID=UPI002FD1DA0B